MPQSKVIDESKIIALAQWSAMGIIFSLFFSAPLVNIFEVLLMLSTFASFRLRNTLINTLKEPIVFWVFIFYSWILIGAMYSVANSEIAWGFAGGWRKVLMLPFAVCLFNTVDMKRKATLVFLTTSTLCLIYSFLSYALPDMLYHENLPGIIIKNHATQGMFFGIAALLAVIEAENKNHRSYIRFGLYGIAALIAVNIAMITIGRSGYVILTATSATYGLYKTRKQALHKKIFTLLSIFIIATTVLLSVKTSHDRIMQGITEMVEAKKDSDPGSMGVRTFWWHNSLKMIQKNPLLGVGTGGFESAYIEQTKNLTGSATIRTNDPHNQYLKILVENGIIGLALLILFFIACLRQKNLSPIYRVIGLGALIGWCFTSFANSHFSTFHEGHFIWFWLGAMLCEEKK